MQNKQESLKVAIKHRKDEIFGYQFAIDNYAAVVALLPIECPEHLMQHREADINTLTLCDADMMLLADLQFHVTISRSLMAEKMEQRKAIILLQAMESQLTGENRGL